MPTGFARRLWSRTGWARLGRIADALDRIEARVGAAAAGPPPPNEPAPPPPLPPEPDRFSPRLYQRAGLNLLLSGNSGPDRVLAESGEWEQQQIAKLLELAALACARRSGPKIFLDIGAYFGLYALVMDRARLFDRIVAYEPDRANFAQLQAELFLNGAACRIEVHNAAVAEVAGHRQMQRSDRHPTGNRGGVELWRCGPDPRCIPTGVVAIDDEITIDGGLIVAKIDVESGQDAVLRGMRRTIAANECILQVEAYEQQRPATLALLAELGLSVVEDIYPDLFAVNRR